jgi:hypothetical protein
MDDRLRSLFLSEVARQAAFGQRAARDLKMAIESGDLDAFWYSMQNLLVAAGNVSKLLWPSAVKKQSLSDEMRDRGKELRGILSLDDSSALKCRELRNQLEHFDEYLHKWEFAPAAHGIVDDNIGSIKLIAANPRGYLRNYDPLAEVLHLHGNDYQIRPVVDALDDLASKIKRMRDPRLMPHN